MKKQTNNKNIKLYIITALILLLVVSLYSLIVRELLARDSRIMMDELSAQGKILTEERIDNTFTLMHNFSDYISSLDDFKSEKSIQYLKNQLKSSNGLRFVVSDISGNCVTTDGSGGNIKNESIFQDALKGKDILSGVTPSVVMKGTKVIVFSVPIRQNGQIVGTLSNVHDMKEAERTLSYSLFQGKGHIYIIQKNGSAVIWPDNNVLGFTDETTFSDSSLIKDRPKLKQLQTLMKTGDSGLLKYSNNIRLTSSYLAYEPLKINDWYLLLTVSEQVIAKRTQMVTLLTLLISFITAIIFFILSSMLFRNKLKHQKLIEKFAYHDSLTGLPNLNYLKGIYSDLPMPEQKYGFVMFKIYHFNLLNSMFGYSAGSRLMKNFAHIITSILQHDDYGFRLSSANFALLLQCSSKEDLTERINHLFSELTSCSLADGMVIYDLKPTIYGGAFYIDGAKKNIDTLLDETKFTMLSMRKEADLHAYSWCYFDKSIAEKISQNQKLEKDIINALKNHEFIPYFQPHYNIGSHEIIGAEILARWNHPTEGILLPNTFLPILEEAGTILELDMIMLEEACKILNHWLSEGLLPVPLSINISRLNIYRHDFIKRLTGILNKYEIPPNLIALELDNIAIYENEEKTIQLARCLKQSGFILIMDNFGTTEVSLNCLYKIPLDAIKLNRQFVLNAIHNPDDALILHHLLMVMRDLSISLVAEGIETEEQLDFILDTGCTAAQGNFLSPPLNEQDFETLVFSELQ